MNPRGLEKASWRRRMHEVIFEADTRSGKAFDIALLILIVISVLIVSLESVTSVRAQYGLELRVVEWAITALFSIEYILRIASVRHPLRYTGSFFGIVDLLAIIPTFLSVIIPGSQSLSVIRALRVLRIFRVLKLGHFVGEVQVLKSAMRASARKIIVFLAVVLTIVLIMGALMYLIEGEEGGFTSIPASIYWAIVTMTTVGYGDIAPNTLIGRILASALMIMGYGIIAVPTGIVSVELARPSDGIVSTQACPSCAGEGHDSDAVHCKHCGAKL